MLCHNIVAHVAFVVSKLKGMDGESVFSPDFLYVAFFKGTRKGHVIDIAYKYRIKKSDSFRQRIGNLDQMLHGFCVVAVNKP